MTTVTFLGDSITHAFIALNNYPNVTNLAVSGNRVVNVIASIREAKPINSDRIIILVGINDIMGNNGYWNNYYCPVYKAYDCLFESLNTLKKEIILLSVLPINSGVVEEGNVRNLNNQINELNNYLKNNQYGYKYVSITNLFVDELGFLKKEYTFDGVHLTGEGYKKYLEGIKDLI